MHRRMLLPDLPTDKERRSGMWQAQRLLREAKTPDDLDRAYAELDLSTWKEEEVSGAVIPVPIEEVYENHKVRLTT